VAELRHRHRLVRILDQDRAWLDPGGAVDRHQADELRPRLVKEVGEDMSEVPLSALSVVRTMAFTNTEYEKTMEPSGALVREFVRECSQLLVQCREFARANWES